MARIILEKVRLTRPTFADLILRYAAIVMIEEATIDVTSLPGRLYSTGQITLATFIGAPIAGCILLAHNYRELHRVQAAFQSLIWGVVSTLILFVVALWLPEKFPNSALPVAYCFAMRQVSSYLQGPSITQHFSKGGKKGSWPATLGIGVACLVLVVGLFFGALYVWYSATAA
jgi:hypothetical protein